jgi:hypothetical protein
MTRPGWMPSPTQELIFVAALDPSEKAITAWRSWTQQVDLVHDDLEGDTFRLLSLVYENLSARLPDDPLMDKLKGITRYHWTKTQLSLGYGARAVRLLESEAIPTLLFKGAALISAGYARPASRMMHDFDVLVADTDRDRALALLLAHGWAIRDEIPPTRYPMMYSLDLIWPADRTGLDLHWFSLSENCVHGADDDFWRDAEPVTLQGAQTRRLNDSDLCFHIIAHGARWDPEPSHRWVTDMLLLLRGNALIDWDRVCYDAEKRELTLLIAAMLAYVQETFAAPVPPAVITGLRGRRTKVGQRVEYWARNHQRARWEGPSFHIQKYWRLTHGKNGLRISPTHYLRDWWGVPRTIDLPATIWHKAQRKLRRPQT